MKIVISPLLRNLITGFTVAACTTLSAQAAPMNAFSDNFEGTLSAWTDRNPGASPDSAIFADPLRPGNHVLGFNRTQAAGSIYTTDLVTTSGQFTVSFEYLGLPNLGGVPGDLGGFFGISLGFPGDHFWVAGTLDSYGTPVVLIDDGTWHSYNLTFSSPIGQQVHLMFEDFSGSGNVAGDAFFDNIQFNDSQEVGSVPEPASLALLGLGLAGIGFSRRKNQKAA